MKNNNAIQIDDEGTVHLSGELTFESTPGFYRQLENEFESTGDVISVDLTGITRTDSAGLALLLEWQAMANRQNRSLLINQAPDSLLRLAKLCEADKLLKLSSRSE